MDKEAELLWVNGEAIGSDGSPAESGPPVPYRIICNSEHFIVLNPVQRKRPKETVRVDERHEERGPVLLRGEREKHDKDGRKQLF